MPVGGVHHTVVAACAAVVLSTAVTVGVVFADLSSAGPGSEGQVALDSVAAAVGLGLGYLLYGRYRSSGLPRDALLCTGMLVLGGGNAGLSVLPTVLDPARGPWTLAAASAGLCSALLFTAAVWHPTGTRPPARRPRHPALVTAGAAGAVIGIAALMAASASLDGQGSTDTFGWTLDPALDRTALLAAAALALAAVGWCRPGARDDTMAAALAAACVLGATFRLDFAAAEAPGSAWAGAATVLRVVFYATLVMAAALEVRAYWRRVAQAAVLEERRRIARDLHDGLAQELAFIATQSRQLADDEMQASRARLVTAASERALDESRRAIAALTRPLDEHLDVALAQCAEEICERFGAALSLDVQPGLEVSSGVREAVLRIVREAVTNAARHGGARRLTIRLHGGVDGIDLRVEDDGTGFDPGELRHLSGRLGLTSMRERTEALGGTFTIARRAEQGTRVVVLLP